MLPVTFRKCDIFSALSYLDASHSLQLVCFGVCAKDLNIFKIVFPNSIYHRIFQFKRVKQIVRGDWDSDLRQNETPEHHPLDLVLLSPFSLLEVGFLLQIYQVLYFRQPFKASSKSSRCQDKVKKYYLIMPFVDSEQIHKGRTFIS